MKKGPSSSPSPLSFEDLKSQNLLSLEVQGTNWQYMKRVLAIEDTLLKIHQKLGDMLMEIGRTVVDGESPDPVDLVKAQKLQAKLQTLELRCMQIKDQMRGAMREKLASMLPPGCIDRIPEDDLASFFAELDHTTVVQLQSSRVHYS